MTRNRISKEMIDKKFVGEVDGLSQQLADKAEKQEVQNALSRKRDALTPITLNDADPELLAAIQGGEGTSFELLSIPRPGSVGPSETTFAKKGKNLFDGNFVYGMSVPGGGNGTITETAGAITAVVKVEPGKTYNVTKTAGSSDLFRIYVMEGYPKIGDKPRFISYTDSSGYQPVTMTGNEDHIIVYLSSAAQSKEPEKFQVEEGATFTGYESPGKVRIDLSAQSLNHKAVKSRYGVINGTDYDALNLSIQNQKVTTKSNGYVQFGNSRITLKDGEFTFGGLQNAGQTICLNPATKNIEFVPATSINNPEYDDLIILGYFNAVNGAHTVFGFYSFEGQPVKPFAPEEEVAPPKLIIPNMTLARYTADVPEWNVYSGQLDVLYGLFDALVAEFPDYVTKTFLANDEAGLPINMYEFKPTALRYNYTYPKIIATATHGHERHAIYGLAYFFNDLARNWQTKEALQMLRWNVHFVVVPCQNPWGFNNQKRPNYNGVDLNRNYSAEWSPEYTNIDYDYPGTEPLSEIGTQTMDTLLSQNKDALFVLDNHNYGGDPTQNGTLLFTSPSIPGDSEKIGEEHVRLMSILSKQDGYVAVDKSIGTVDTIGFKGAFYKQAGLHGIDGILLENTSVLNGSASTQGVNNPLFRFNIESPGNALLVALRHYAE